MRNYLLVWVACLATAVFLTLPSAAFAGLVVYMDLSGLRSPVPVTYSILIACICVLTFCIILVQAIHEARGWGSIMWMLSVFTGALPLVHLALILAYPHLPAAFSRPLAPCARLTEQVKLVWALLAFMCFASLLVAVLVGPPARKRRKSNKVKTDAPATVEPLDASQPPPAPLPLPRDFKRDESIEPLPGALAPTEKFDEKKGPGGSFKPK
ncbi:MAG TPA: hypothetical protein PKV72_00255 [Candidatus Peribacteria bacterium]|nr:hypothetical protein [Candidatus Peribacteria bacterium]